MWMQLTRRKEYTLSVLTDNTMPADDRTQGINKHGIGSESRNFPSLASYLRLWSQPYNKGGGGGGGHEQVSSKRYVMWYENNDWMGVAVYKCMTPETRECDSKERILLKNSVRETGLC